MALPERYCRIKGENMNNEPTDENIHDALKACVFDEMSAKAAGAMIALGNDPERVARVAREMYVNKEMDALHYDTFVYGLTGEWAMPFLHN
jgi:hypothetical protein